MAARKLRCGYVESKQIERGWACCECHRAHGIAVYNGKDRAQCKQCGHERCKGAMRRKWPGKEIAVPPEAVGGLLGAFMRIVGAFVPPGQARQRAAEIAPVDPAKDPRWQKACDDVVAAFAAAQLRAQQAGRETNGPPIDKLAQSVRSRVSRAAEIFDGHPLNTPPCRCRHYSLIVAGAEQVSEMTGADYDLLAKSGVRVLDWYLSQRS